MQSRRRNLDSIFEKQANRESAAIEAVNYETLTAKKNRNSARHLLVRCRLSISPHLRRRTIAIISPRRKIIHFKTPHFAAEVHRYAKHGRELVGCKSPVLSSSISNGSHYTK